MSSSDSTASSRRGSTASHDIVSSVSNADADVMHLPPPPPAAVTAYSQSTMSAATIPEAGTITQGIKYDPATCSLLIEASVLPGGRGETYHTESDESQTRWEAMLRVAHDVFEDDSVKTNDHRLVAIRSAWLGHVEESSLRLSLSGVMKGPSEGSFSAYLSETDQAEEASTPSTPSCQLSKVVHFHLHTEAATVRLRRQHCELTAQDGRSAETTMPSVDLTFQNLTASDIDCIRGSLRVGVSEQQ